MRRSPFSLPVFCGGSGGCSQSTEQSLVGAALESCGVGADGAALRVYGTEFDAVFGTRAGSRSLRSRKVMSKDTCSVVWRVERDSVEVATDPSAFMHARLSRLCPARKWPICDQNAQ